MHTWITLDATHAYNAGTAFVESLFDYLAPRVAEIGSPLLISRFSDIYRDVLQASVWDLTGLAKHDYQVLLRLTAAMEPHLAEAMNPWVDRFSYVYEMYYRDFVAMLQSFVESLPD